MDMNGRYNHIEDVLIRLHTGGWVGFSDPLNKTYANLIIHDDTKAKPTEKELTDALVKQQEEFDKNAYQRDRLYPQLGEQLDMLFHDMTVGKGDKTGEWYKALAKVKSDNPKPTE